MHKTQVELINFPFKYTMYKSGLWKGCFYDEALNLLKDGWFDKTQYNQGEENHVLKEQDEGEESGQLYCDSGESRGSTSDASQEDELDRRLGSASKRRGRPRKAGH
ncbi:MAG TPA: hypothetical protein VNU45_17850 [Rummeliibacillus sp.]|nr:hypothetical protein [Rummeliibacillus sp.]